MRFLLQRWPYHFSKKVKTKLKVLMSLQPLDKNEALKNSSCAFSAMSSVSLARWFFKGKWTQCDQIGRYLKDLRCNFSHKSSPCIWRHFLKIAILNLNFCGNFWGKLGYFLFQYLVTLKVVIS